MTVLLVDSDKEALDRETKRLTERQYAVTVSLYSNADDAIRFAMYHDVDVVFTRAVLAEMSGQELIRQIRRFQPAAKCYILPEADAVPFSQFFSASQDALRVETERPRDSRHMDSKGIPAQASSPHQQQKEGDQSMTEQELRSLSRKELLEVMIQQGREMEACKSKYEKDLEFLRSEHEKNLAFLKTEQEKQLADLTQELEAARKALESREIAINEAGSIAIAALQLNGVFEAAQAASQQYIENIRSLSERQATICAQRDSESQAQALRLQQETERKCAEMEAACRQRCADMEAEARQKSESYWAQVSSRLQEFYDRHQELKQLLNFSTTGFHT